RSFVYDRCLSCLFFFSMLPRPPSATLFPYTTLFRSNGLKLDPATGGLSGTPSAAGSFKFTVQLADAAKASVTHGLAVTINPPLAIDTTALADGKVGAAYSQQVKVSGGTTPYKFAAVGALPAGL